MASWRNRITDWRDKIAEYLLTNRTIWWLSIPILLFFVLMATFEANFLIKWESWILALISAGVSVTYIGAVITGLITRGPMPRYTHLALGIFLGWFSIVMNRSWVGMIRMYPLEQWMRESYFIAFYVWTSIVAAIFHLTAPGAIDGRVPTTNWIKIGVAIMFGIVLGVLATIVLSNYGIGSNTMDFSPLNVG